MIDIGHPADRTTISPYHKYINAETAELMKAECIHDTSRKGMPVRSTSGFQVFSALEGGNARTFLQGRMLFNPLTDYDFGLSEWEHLRKFVMEKLEVLGLVTKFPSILRNVYGEKAKKEITLAEDPESSEVTVEITIFAEMPIDDEFWKKDRRIYDEIVNAGLAGALEHVVIRHR